MPETVLQTMRDPLAEMRAAITADVTLPKSGRIITGELPDIQECLLAGDIPLPVLAEMEKLAKNPSKDGREPTSEELRIVHTLNQNLVMGFVQAIDGVPVTLVRADLKLFDTDDFNEMVLYASRAKPLPGKD